MMSIPKYIKSNNQLIFYNNFSPFITAGFASAPILNLTRPDRKFPLDENEMQNLCLFCEMSARVLCVETGLEVNGSDIDPIIPEIINFHLKEVGCSKKDLLTQKKYLYHQLKLIRYMQEDDTLSKSDTRDVERVVGLAAEAMNRCLRNDGEWVRLFAEAVWDPQRVKDENPKTEKSFEKNKEKKSSKEKTEKNRKSDFKSKRDQSRTEEKTNDKLSVDFSLLGKNKEFHNRNTRHPKKEKITKSENTSVLKWILSGKKLPDEDADKIIDNDPMSVVITILFFGVILLSFFLFINF